MTDRDDDIDQSSDTNATPAAPAIVDPEGDNPPSDEIPPIATVQPKD